MPGMGVSRAAAQVRVRVSSRVRVRSPSQHYKKTNSFIKSDNKSDDVPSDYTEFSFNSYLKKDTSESGNRVMVVIDSTLQAKGALDWALSHTLQSQDTIILLHIPKQDGKSKGDIDPRAYDLLRSTKNVCQLKRPEVHVEMAIGEGKDKGAIIVDEAKRLKASLLVLGHRKQSFIRRVHMIWTRKKPWNRVVDYCIENAHCMTIAVRRKSKKYGGYLITTKRHKNFWLLA